MKNGCNIGCQLLCGFVLFYSTLLNNQIILILLGSQARDFFEYLSEIALIVKVEQGIDFANR